MMQSEEDLRWVQSDSYYDTKRNSLLKAIVFDVEQILDSMSVQDIDISSQIQRLSLILMISQKKALFRIIELMICKLDNQGLLLEQFKELTNSAEARAYLENIRLEPIQELVTVYLSYDLSKYHEIILATIKSIANGNQQPIKQIPINNQSSIISTDEAVQPPIVVNIEITKQIEQVKESNITSTERLDQNNNNSQLLRQDIPHTEFIESPQVQKESTQENDIQLVSNYEPQESQIQIDHDNHGVVSQNLDNQSQVQIHQENDSLLRSNLDNPEQNIIQACPNPQTDNLLQFDPVFISEETHVDQQPQIELDYQKNCPLYSGMSILDLYQCLSKLNLQFEWWRRIDQEFKSTNSDDQIQGIISRIAPVLLGRFLEQKANSLNPTFESQYNDIFDSDKESRSQLHQNQNEQIIQQQESLSVSADSIVSEQEVYIDEKQTLQSQQNKLIQYYKNPHYREFQPHQFDPTLSYLVSQQDMMVKLKSLTTNKLYDIFIDSLLKEESNAIFQNKEFENILIVIYNVMKILNHRYSTEIHCVQEDKYFVALFELKLKGKLLERKVEKHLSQTKTNILIRLFAIKFMLLRCYHIPKPMMIFDLIDLLLAKIPQKRLTQPIIQEQSNECQIINPIDNYKSAYEDVNSKKCHKKQQEIQAQKQIQERQISSEKEKKQSQQIAPNSVPYNPEIQEMKQQIDAIMQLLKSRNTEDSYPKREKSPKKKSRKETSKEREDKQREERIQRRLEQKEKDRLELERQEIERQELNKKEIEKRQKKQEKEKKLQEKRELEEIKEKERKQQQQLKEQEQLEQLKQEELKRQEEYQNAQRKLMIEREAEIERNRQKELIEYQLQQQNNYRNQQFDYPQSRPAKKEQSKQRFFYDKIDNLYPPSKYQNQPPQQRAQDLAKFQRQYDLKPYKAHGPPTQKLNPDESTIDMMIGFLAQMKQNK